MGRQARRLRKLASGQGAPWTLMVLLLVGFLRAAPLLHAESRTVTSTLILQVTEAALVEQQNDNVIVKVRLSPGVAASLWGDKSCTTPTLESLIITASGTYTLPLNQIKQAQPAIGDGEASICMQSSDGLLRRSLPVMGGASLTGAKTSASKSATYSGHVSIPAARIPTAKTPPCCAQPNSPALR